MSIARVMTMMVSIRKHLRKSITHITLALVLLKVGKSSAVSIAETLDCLKKYLKHAESGRALLYTHCVKY